MAVFNQLSPNRITEKPIVFAFGTFDGVHLGHQKVIQRVIHHAREKNALSAILTFSNHPISIIRPEKKILYLTNSEQKVELIKQLGVDIIINIPFTKELAQISAFQFIQSVTNTLPIVSWIAGEDVHFGKDKEGNLDYLLAESNKFGFEVEAMEKLLIDETPVSSSRIRKCIQEGDLTAAHKLLGRPLSFLCKTNGVLQRTEKENRIFCYAANFCLPPQGLYNGEVQENELVYKAIFNVGSTLDGLLEVDIQNLPSENTFTFLEVRFLNKIL